MMAELRAEYVASIPQKIADIKSHTAAGDRELLRNDFHKLKGTGKTYGIPEISELGLVFEKYCLQNPANLDFTALAIELLAAIHEARLSDSPFVLDTKPEFKQLKDKVL
jgi:HPt (histidine-containing phosphotransfer) domain-containing protein